MLPRSTAPLSPLLPSSPPPCPCGLEGSTGQVRCCILAPARGSSMDRRQATAGRLVLGETGGPGGSPGRPLLRHCPSGGCVPLLAPGRGLGGAVKLPICRPPMGSPGRGSGPRQPGGRRGGRRGPRQQASALPSCVGSFPVLFFSPNTS